MENVHDFKIRDIEFSGYLLNFRKSLIIPCARNVKVGEFVRMFEHNEESGIITGRSLMFQILFVDKSPGLIGIGNLWCIDLKKVEVV